MMRFRRFRSLSRALMVPALVLPLLVACGGGDDNDEPTATSVPPTATTAPTLVATVAPTFVNSGQIISDGLCQANVPDEWIDDTTGRGTTGTGARYALFGGRVRSSDAWTEAVNLVKSQAGARPGAQVSEGENFVRVDFADNRGLEYRLRFDTLYCDFSVTSSSPIPDDERALWDNIIASLRAAGT